MSNQPPVTLKDIARAVDLSHSAVSLALRNSHRIAKATRQRVQKAAREMGYQPNPMAAGLAQFKRISKVVPVQAALAWLNFWPDPKILRSFREFDGYWRGAAACAEKYGYRLEEFVVNKEMPLSRIEKIMRARNISGILVPPGGEDIVMDWDALHWERFSAVRFGRGLDGVLPSHSVSTDQAANGSLGFRKIREKGYERIGFVGGGTERRVFVAGFLQAQLDVPETSRIPPLLFSSLDISENQKLLVPWLGKNKPDAIFNDSPEVPWILKQAGYHVPKDIGLAGTTVLDIDVDAGIDQHPEEIGRVAILVLISLINDSDRGAPPLQRGILVKGTWVDGSTLPGR